MSYFYHALAWLTSKLRCSTAFLTMKCDELLFWFYKKIDASNDDIQNEIVRFSSGVEEFYTFPKKLSATLIDQKYSGSVETYFLLKQAVSLYEAHSKALPLQVFNEMRNALDHFIRSQIGDAGNETKHIKKLEDHLQRALFDVIKITCAFYDEETRKKHAMFPKRALALVDNGHYVKKYYALHTACQKTFTDAKFEDYKLGSDEKEEEVRRLYIKALISHKDLYIFQSDNFGKMHWGLGKLGLGVIFTIITSLVAGLILIALGY